ncbi:sporulation initiation inhibitor Soj homolog [Streptococcus pneumoniae]|uniref:ParA family protein n=1 Tax=Streptococcus pneumoniae TaxID=1313 RepID=UPI00076996B3|nr:ParA family protein [Streptococcus pneumoniae]CZE33331.1 sporulation initiation inhibitor Soj homolog [Streptococcus pneumoniae]
MDVITIINQKGGVGKSTTALALGHGLMAEGHRVLFIDLDAQGNISYTLGGDTSRYNALGVLQLPEIAQSEVQRTGLGDIIPSTPALSGADSILTETGKEYKLKEALDALSKTFEYDYVVIDTPPALGILTINALTASKYAIIPAQADIYSLQGITQLNNTIQVVKKYTNPDLKVLGITLTRYNARATLTRELTELLERTAKELDTKVFKTRIRENIAVKEAQAVRQNLYEYAPNSNASKDYQALTKEILTDIIF